MNRSNQTLTAIDQAVKVSEQLPCELKFFVQQEVLLNALKKGVKAIDSRSAIPILGHILFIACKSGSSDQIILASANFLTAICLPLDGQVEREGAFTIKAQTFLQLLKSLPKGSLLTVEVKADLLLVTCGTLTLSLKGGHPASTFSMPWLERVDELDISCAMNSEVLRHAIKEIHYAAADDEARPVFTAICLSIKAHQMDVIATDAIRLAKRTITLSDVTDGYDGALLVPVSSMRRLIEVMPPDVQVTLFWDKALSRIVFQAGQVCLVSTLIQGTFPNIAQAIPTSHQTVLSLVKRDLVQMFKAFKPFCLDGSRLLRVSYQTSGSVAFHLESERLGYGDNVLVTEVEGVNGEVALNIQLLEQIVTNVKAEIFTFYLSGRAEPVVIVPMKRDDHLCLLMPMVDRDDCRA